MKELIFNDQLSDMAKLFYLKLWFAYGKKCEASNKDLKKLFGVEVDTIIRRLRELKAVGFIETEHKHIGGEWRTIYLKKELKFKGIRS